MSYIFTLFHTLKTSLKKRIKNDVVTAGFGHDRSWSKGVKKKRK